jgi:hypothetical protein
MWPPKASIRILIAAYPFKDQVKIVPEKLIKGKNERGILIMELNHVRPGESLVLIEIK